MQGYNKSFWLVRLPRSYKERVNATAKKLGFTNTGLLAHALNEWLENHKNGL